MLRLRYSVLLKMLRVRLVWTFVTPLVMISEVSLAADDATSSGGLPQLDFTTYGNQAFWVLVFFSLLFFVFSRKILPDVSVTIENRREHIQSDLDNADELRENAETARQTYEELLKGANQAAMEQMRDADQALKNKAAKALEKFNDKSQDMIAETSDALEAAKAKALNDMHDVAAEVASLAAEKIVGVSTDIGKAKTLVKNLDKKAA